MLTKKYFDNWLKDLESKYQVLSMPSVTMLDLFIGSNHPPSNDIGISVILSEMTKVRLLRDELISKKIIQ